MSLLHCLVLLIVSRVLFTRIVFCRKSKSSRYSNKMEVLKEFNNSFYILEQIEDLLSSIVDACIYKYMNIRM